MTTYPIDPRTLNPGESFIGDHGLFLTLIRSRQIGIVGAAIGCTELLVREHGREAGGLFYATYLHGERVHVTFNGKPNK